MNFLVIDAMLLFALSVPVVMRYRILPVSGTPYWLFGTLFFMLVGYLILSFVSARRHLSERLDPIKTALFWGALVIVLGGTVVTSIIDRSKTAPVYGVHDIILQQEAAMRYLLQSKNPYKETYFGTPLEMFGYDEGGKPAVNPALYHFVMPPWYLLFPFAFYFMSVPILGYFDGRMSLVFLVFVLLFVLARWYRHKGLGRLAIILTALSPAGIDYFIEGRSDLFVLSWFIFSLYLLEKKHFFWSAVLAGFAITSKQTIWFAIPFYFAYLWSCFSSQDGKRTLTFAKRPLVFGQCIGITAVVVGIITGPFLFWDARAFVESTILYLSGASAHSYPISGYGLGMVLYQLGFIRDLHSYYPFILWQAVFGIPIAFFCLRWVIQKPLMSRVLMGYALTLFVWWYLSRYLNNSHLGYISSLFILGALKNIDEKADV